MRKALAEEPEALAFLTQELERVDGQEVDNPEDDLVDNDVLDNNVLRVEPSIGLIRDCKTRSEL